MGMTAFLWVNIAVDNATDIRIPEGSERLCEFVHYFPACPVSAIALMAVWVASRIFTRSGTTWGVE